VLKLEATKVVLGASFKKMRSFESSDGTDITVSYTIPSGLERKELMEQCFREEYLLAKFVRTNEALKGYLSPQELAEELDNLKEAYGRVVNGGRVKGEEKESG